MDRSPNLVRIGSIAAAFLIFAPFLWAQTPRSYVGSWLCQVESVGTSEDGATRRHVVRYRISFTDVGADGSWVSGSYTATASFPLREATAVGRGRLSHQDGYYSLSFQRPDRITACRGQDPDDCSERNARVGFSKGWSNAPSSDPGYSETLQLLRDQIRGSSTERSPDDVVKTHMSCERVQD